MALPDVHQPARSISLPSRIHSPSVKLEAALTQLKPWQTSSSSSSSLSLSLNGDPFGAETLQMGLINLTELYNCVHDLIQSPHTCRGLGKLVEDTLDGSVILLDTCDAVRNILLTMRDLMQNLQSAFRRKGKSNRSSIESQVHAYVALRKKAKKEINKRIVGLKSLESNACFSAVLVNADYQQETLVKALREATTITISIFRSLLLFLSTTSFKPKACWLSLISKLIPLRSLSSPSSPSSSSSQKREKQLINELQSLDLVLYSFHENSDIEVEVLKKMLESFDDSIQGLEAGLDSTYKCLVRNRVSFLNILTCHC